jgi:hypothetical protein
MAKISFANAKIEISTDGTTWTDISGLSNQLEVSGGDRQLSEAYIFSQDVPEILTGKREPIQIQVRVYYDEALTLFTTVENAYQSAAPLYVRWSPRGGATGQFRFQASGPVQAFTYPAGQANAEPVMAGFTLRVPSITRSVIP